MHVYSYLYKDIHEYKARCMVRTIDIRDGKCDYCWSIATVIISFVLTFPFKLDSFKFKITLNF